MCRGGRGIDSGFLQTDRSHPPLHQATIYWPTEPGFPLENTASGVTAKGYFYAANRFATAEHGGTHIDAPIHFFAQRQTVDQIPVWRLMGPSVCVDVSRNCAVDRDYLVTVEDLQAWENTTEESLDNKIVLIRTGFGRYWPNRKQYLGTAETGRAAVPCCISQGSTRSQRGGSLRVAVYVPSGSTRQVSTTVNRTIFKLM